MCDVLTGITNHTSINIDDNNSCTVDACDLFTGIISHTTFQLNLTATNTTMIGGSNGSVAAAPSGGTPPYTCVWLPNDTTASLTNVGAGTYTVTVTDANGCSVTGTIIVYEPSCPSTTISFTTFLSSSKPGTPTSLWLNIHTKLTAGSLPNNGDFIKITNVNATLNNILSNPAISSMSIPNGKIIADSTVITPSTIYNTSTNEWITRIAPGDTSNDIFITGGIINSINGFLALTGKNSTVSASWYSNKSSLASSWFYGLACYQPQFSYSNIAGPNKVLPIAISGAKAGTPSTITTSLVSGGSGNGSNNNYTGSYSALTPFSACQTFGSRSSLHQVSDLTYFHLSAYPNPFNDQINIEMVTPNAGNAKIEVTDITGRINESSMHESGKILIGSNLKPGIYFVTVSQDGFSQVIKVVKKN